MHRTILWIWVLLALLVTPTFVSCDSGGSSDSENDMDTEVNAMGMVTSDSDAPIEGAVVEINRSDNGIALDTTSTDSTGAYETTFTVSEANTPPQLQMKFAAAGFTNKEITVDFGTEINLDVTLEQVTPESLGGDAAPKTGSGRQSKGRP